MVQIITYILLGLSLSVDAITIAISYGTKFNRNIEKINMTLLVGIFHFIMPIFGCKIANIIDNTIIIKTKFIVLIIFIFLIIEMIRDNNEEKKEIKKSIITILLTSLVVSIDSFTIGIAIGLSHEKIILASSIFSIISSVGTFIGINIGNNITKKEGKYSKIIGISLLIIVSIKYLLFG